MTGGNSYKYKLAANPTEPEFGKPCKTGYTAWDGLEEIAATAGQKIVIVEVDTNSNCVRSGIADVVVAD